MNRKQELNAFIKECITNSLIRLMEKTAFEDITITELVNDAGVSRASFYRNFESKKDILTQYLRALMREWGEDFESHNDITYFSESLLLHYYKNKDFYLLLYKHRMSDLVFETIRWATRIDESSNHIERYTKSAVAGLLFGSVDEWMRQGMQETPEEILLLTSNFS
ncbi:MAG: TetR/AcrR family transcriptional regulator [Lachnospiraceae bacterium]|nr:TetR/AcrR family transcriptional regulator [Lachnospiraceae bacterium]